MADYPHHLIRQVRLRDGTAITLRPIRPEDAALEQAFVRGLSDESRYYRFLDMLRELSPQMLQRLVDVDYRDHMALIALVEEDAGPREIAVARYIVNPDGRSCEFAIVVDDRWQGTGVAGLLMQHLFEAARARGLERMTGDVLATNQRMLRFVHALGFRHEAHPDDPTLMMVTKDL
jgi:acetyltransferase